jgi:rhamnose transport system permease protein
MKGHMREIAIAVTNVLLLVLLAATTHGFFTLDNLSDLFLANMPVMLIALGMTLIIVTAQIDISVGSVFALCSVFAGIAARSGAPWPVFLLLACVAGAACGAINGALCAYVRIPSIVVTLATMVALRDGLRWGTQGAWVGNLPQSFQRFGMRQSTYTIAVLALTVLFTVATGLGLRYLHADGCADGACGDVERGALQPGAEQLRHRA